MRGNDEVASFRHEDGVWKYHQTIPANKGTTAEHFFRYSKATMANQLKNETSPYLQQHADNPVDWYPWNQAALEKARTENKLILLSIGYSACHWCHVMAHESFADDATARVMNDLYINIKVDREERPDLDKIFQSAHHLLNQRGGGWPLTVILTPDEHIPFFAGTYFPDKPKHGMPAFTDVLQQVAAFYNNNRTDIDKQNTSLMEALGNMQATQATSTDMLNATPIDSGHKQLAQSFDKNYGGFGGAPKFPHPTNLEFLLRHWHATQDRGTENEQSYNMVHMTLHAMASGGLYDQLGGGFTRYSVDEKWMIPHFEKMLYDNGPLLSLYADAFAAFQTSIFKRICNETADWVMREMQSPHGGYYSTLDADSEGVEGKFYIWTPDSVKPLLSDDEYKVVEQFYGLNLPANFESPDDLDWWHLHVYQSTQSIADALRLPENDVTAVLNNARKKLFTAREQRIKPGRDEKILTAWNGLMIKGMASAAKQLQRSDLISSAQAAVDFIRTHLYKDGRLLATHKDGKSHLTAYLDDYAFLMDGLLELLQAQWRDSDMQLLVELADSVLKYFMDEQHGGFYFTAHDHEHLIQRPKPTMDESTPAGNAIAATTLQRLGHLLGEQRYLDAARGAIEYAWQSMAQLPHAHGAFLIALEEYLYPGEFIVIRSDTMDWAETLNKVYVPRRTVLSIPGTATCLPGLLAQREATNDHTPLAYRCSGTSCQSPVSTLEALF